MANACGVHKFVCKKAPRRQRVCSGQTGSDRTLWRSSLGKWSGPPPGRLSRYFVCWLRLRSVTSPARQVQRQRLPVGPTTKKRNTPNQTTAIRFRETPGAFNLSVRRLWQTRTSVIANGSRFRGCSQLWVYAIVNKIIHWQWYSIVQDFLSDVHCNYVAISYTFSLVFELLELGATSWTMLRR